MEREADTLERLLAATAAGSPIDREQHALSVLGEVRRVRLLDRRLDTDLLDRVRAPVPEKEEDS